MNEHETGMSSPDMSAPDSSEHPLAGQIREHMEVIGADGTHVGTVDHVDGHRIKLARTDSSAGEEAGPEADAATGEETGRAASHHHYLSLGLVAAIEGNVVRLSANGDVAYGMEEEEGATE